MGFRYYRIRNKTQNYIILSIISSPVIIITFLMTGGLWLATYILHTKFTSYIVFFNLIIIQNTYLKDLKENNYKSLILIVCLILCLGVFYSLRTLAYG